MKLSIIIPVYNAEKTIERCIKSLLPLKEKTEVIFIDDGSTDRSGFLLDSYKRKWGGQCEVLHTDNRGVSAARNLGIQAATGEYVTFVDSDDYIKADTYEKVIVVLEQSAPDMLEIGFSYVSGGNKTWNAPMNKLQKDRTIPRKEILEKIVPRLINLTGNNDYFIYDYVWNKVFKRDILTENNIQFDENRKMWEDRPFEVQFLKYSQMYYSLSEYGYYYVNTEGSLSNRTDMSLPLIVLENFRLYKELYENIIEKDFYNEYMVGYYCGRIYETLLRVCKLFNYTEIKNILCNLNNDSDVQKLFNCLNPKTRAISKFRRLLLQNNSEEKIYRLCIKENKKKISAQKIKTFTARIRSYVRKV